MFLHFSIGEFVITTNQKASDTLKYYRKSSTRYIRLLRRENKVLQEKVKAAQDQLRDLQARKG